MKNERVDGNNVPQINNTLFYSWGGILIVDSSGISKAILILRV